MPHSLAAVSPRKVQVHLVKDTWKAGNTFFLCIRSIKPSPESYRFTAKRKETVLYSCVTEPGSNSIHYSRKEFY